MGLACLPCAGYRHLAQGRVLRKGGRRCSWSSDFTPAASSCRRWCRCHAVRAVLLRSTGFLPPSPPPYPHPPHSALPHLLLPSPLPPILLARRTRWWACAATRSAAAPRHTPLTWSALGRRRERWREVAWQQQLRQLERFWAAGGRSGNNSTHLYNNNVQRPLTGRLTIL